MDETPRKPATVEEARRALDLTTFPLPEGPETGRATVPMHEGAESGSQRAIAVLRYKTGAQDAKTALDFVRKKFTEMNWKEVGETYVSEASASCTFAGKGFVANVNVSKDSSQAGDFSVSIWNRGNVNLAKLPVPPDAKPEHSTPTSVGYFTEQSPDEAREAVHKLLTEQGWTPYGQDLSTKKYKQNAIELSAYVYAIPAFDKKTMIRYSTSQMSADLPAPPQALDVTYTDYMSPPKQLLFETAAARDELYEFYRDTLAKEGWQPTTEKPITDQYKAFMIFRNKAKDLMELETENPQEGKIRGTLKHQSAAELAEIERLIELDRPRREAELKRKLKEEADEKARLEQEKRDKEAAEKARRRVVVELPADAKAVTFKAGEIKFSVPLGKAKTAAEAIGKPLRDNGWKERNYATSTTAGTLDYRRDGQSVNISYSDTQFLGTEVIISGFRVDFERGAAGKK
ncbi:MAG: hypothetical protein WD894_13070 [Pirellulales bacterium]